MDHVVIATGRVQETARRLHTEHGFQVMPGAAFPNMGLANWLMPVGTRGQCVELLYVSEPDVAAGDPFGSFVMSQASDREVLLGWAVSPNDFEAVARRLRLTAVAGSGLGADGSVRTWRMLGAFEAYASRFLPFFISWDEPAVANPLRDGASASPRDGVQVLDFSWIELGGDKHCLSTWTGPLKTPIHVVDDQPGLRAIGLHTTTGDLRLDV